jgi:proteasome lid subunit RPN8/RPN11
MKVEKIGDLQKHKSGSPALSHLILAIFSEFHVHIIHVYKSPISDSHFITIRSSNHRFFGHGLTFCETKSGRHMSALYRMVIAQPSIPMTDQ